MKILVLGGAGKIGSAIINDLVRSDGVTEIVGADIHIQQLERVVNEIGSDKVKTAQVDAADRRQLVELMRDGNFDAVASAVLSGFQLNATKAAIEAGVSFVDVGQPYEVFELNDEAKAAGVTIVPSCGLDPGIDRVARGYAMSQLDKVTGIYLWCGGLPPESQKDDNPIAYKISWSWFRAVSGYLGKATIIRNGELVEVPKMKDPGTIVFPELGEFEYFLSRAPFDMFEQLNINRSDLKNSWDASIRYKGHCELWSKLIGLHMTDFEPLEVNMRIQPLESGAFETEYLSEPMKISPFEFLSALGEKYYHYDLDQGKGDMVLLRSAVTGEKNGRTMSINHELIDYYNPDTGMTSMGRTTAFPCSFVAQMIARGDIQERGVVHTGKIGINPKSAEVYFAELAKRNINLTEIVSRAL